MRPENTKEYELLRSEMVTVKECITKYLGYVLGSSGLGIYGMLTLTQNNLKPCFIAVMSFAFAAIMSFVLLILFYKFTSHNRFAGYCKLLNHEHYNLPTFTNISPSIQNHSNEISTFSWEIALERLRASDINPNTLTKLVSNNFKVHGIDINDLLFLLGKYTGRYPQKDYGRFHKGIRILIKALFGKIQTRSWAFPPIVTSAFTIICWGFFLTGIISIIPTLKVVDKLVLEYGEIIYFMYIIGLVSIISISWLWFRFIGKLYCLMNGTSTVDAFFWRFLPVRVAFLNQLGIEPTYIFASELLAEEVVTLKNEFGGISDELH